MQVITGDLVSSASLTLTEKNLIKDILIDFSRDSEGQYEFFIRGDSFQILMPNEALKEALLIKLKLWANMSIQTRVSIGIGTIDLKSERLSDSDGSAFRLSGRGLDAMKEEDQLISIHAEQEWEPKEWQIHSASIDFILSKLTANQAEVLYWSLKGHHQQEIADKIGIHQSSVNRRLKGNGLALLTAIIHRFDQIFVANEH